MKSTKFLISDLKIGINENEQDVIDLARKTLKKAGGSLTSVDFKIFKKSIDARNKSNINFVYTVLAVFEAPICLNDRYLGTKIKPYYEEVLSVEQGDRYLCGRPVVVGMGPAGMFCGLLLAENGYRPIIIDRGDSIENRIKAVENFIKNGILDLDTNIQFGAGGAGTFSDGKLTTRINDPRCTYVLQRFVEFGAPAEILIKAKPHIGTDILRNVVENILKRIEDLGGTVIYRCRMTDIKAGKESLDIITSKGNIKAGIAVLALGHSSRDTYRMLIKNEFAVIPKPFSVGVRVEHLKDDIDKALYGEYAGHPSLGAAEYNLSDTNSDRGVYTFCMCPGGEVVPATSQEYGVVVNGMSRFARNGKNSNSAVAVSVKTSDFGNTPISAIEYQEDIEKRAYALGGGNYFAPIQTMKDFLEDKAICEPSRIKPTYGNGEMCRVAKISDAFPDFVTKRLKQGFLIFDKKIKGYAVNDAVLTGVETRTSAPVRICRTDELFAVGNPLIYPCGEGAGYAGGIMSAAVDGIKVAIEIIKKYRV